MDVQSCASALQASPWPRKQSTEMPAGPSWMYFPSSWQKILEDSRIYGGKTWDNQGISIR